MLNSRLAVDSGESVEDSKPTFTEVFESASKAFLRVSASHSFPTLDVTLAALHKQLCPFCKALLEGASNFFGTDPNAIA